MEEEQEEKVVVGATKPKDDRLVDRWGSRTESTESFEGRTVGYEFMQTPVRLRLLLDWTRSFHVLRELRLHLDHSIKQ